MAIITPFLRNVGTVVIISFRCEDDDAAGRSGWTADSRYVVAFRVAKRVGEMRYVTTSDGAVRPRRIARRDWQVDAVFEGRDRVGRARIARGRGGVGILPRYCHRLVQLESFRIDDPE